MQARQSDGIEWHVADGIGRIVLNRPQQSNSISSRAGAAIAQAIDDVIGAAPRVVLLSGRGKVFCAGGDIGEFQANVGALDRLVDEILTVLHPALARLSGSPVPIVTAINGSVGGAGIGLALCGDFAYATHSLKLRTGYAAIGLSPDAGSSYFMTRRVGAMRAKQLFFLSEPIDAKQCLDWGVVDALFADDELMPAAEALCRRLARAATGSLAAIKQLCDGAERRDLVDHLALEKALLEARARSADAREGVGAFLERRPPRFAGE
jgi:2-(1,2-epoxy-1,2-dihydrophenyl)acetyl-CoA isomerase